MSKTNSPEHFTQPLDGNETLAKSILRHELYEILQQAETIQRLTGLGLLPEAIKDETVKSHTLRLISMVDGLPCDEIIKKACQLTLAVHDLPETYHLIATDRMADTTAVDKALAPDLDMQISATEEQVARNIFNDDEFELYLEFEHASDFLKSRRQEPPTEVGLISKIFDKIDADLHYHKAAIASRNSWQELGNKGPKLGFNLYSAFSNRLNTLKDTRLSDAAILCKKMLNSTMLSIQEMWNEVPPDEVPQIIRECLDNLQIYV